MIQNILNVTVLNGYIHNVFVAEEMLHNIDVCGEISGYKVSGQHSYFTLKDQNSQISCCCFNYRKTYQPLKDGESVIVHGDVDYYAKGGKLNFNVGKITPIGDGLLALQFEQLKAKLSQLGYFDESRKKPIPTYPKRVCVVTSATGAVIKDIITTVRRVNDIVDIAICDVRVQGKDSAKSIINAIQKVDKLGFDIIIIARGGGSFEDLMPFNDEQLVYAIADANTPIISAVGHETDFTLCDFVSDLRVATPTAAAEIIAYDKYDLSEWINNIAGKLKNNLSNMIDKKKMLLDLSYRKIIQRFEQDSSKNRHNLELFRTKLDYNINNHFNIAVTKLNRCITKLDAFNPAKLFNKGYFAISNMQNQSVKKITDLSVNQNVKIVGEGGNALAKIVEVNNEI